MNIRARLLEYLDYKDISRYKFYKSVGVSNGFLDKEGAIGSDKCEKIYYQYPDINLTWLLLGTGPMISEEKQDQVIPEVTPENEDSPYKLLYELQKENAELWKENGELRVENERLKNESVIGRNAIAG